MQFYLSTLLSFLTGFLAVSGGFVVSGAFAQETGQTGISEESRSFTTYPFSDPNPVPALALPGTISRFYPYFMFDGYTDQGVPEDWKVVTLENPYLEVTVLPEVGGKVWGAAEKSTGRDFVYRNHVMKFRAIGSRGPWTSGGIEHNFGLDLGHAPWAASPVDYVIRKEPDGGVSCIVGGLDLASRSRWSVNIHLPADKAYFETRAMWYNPTPLHEAYLSWENAAFRATDDLRFYFPGTHHIGHDGSVSPWPVDEEGRDLSLYRNNRFGSSKSYHVTGAWPNWFGGYWENEDFGFGHWAPYSDAPGKKLWIWSLARDGAIWEDLLTDSDGQYIEAQSGVKFNQAGERGGYHSPFTQLSLRPGYAETKTDYWFPVKATGGMSAASPAGTLNVLPAGDSLQVLLSPNVPLNDTLWVSVGAQHIYSELLQLDPMQVYRKTLPLPPSAAEREIRVRLGANNLTYTSERNKIRVARPLVTPSPQEDYSAERLFRRAEDKNAMRDYRGAMEDYLACLNTAPLHSGALTRLAELHYRKGEYEEGLELARTVLRYNTYDGGANYISGIIYRETGDLVNAEEALSVAARTLEYRSAAYQQIAGIRMQQKDYRNGAAYAEKALDYNRYNLQAWEFLATCQRKLGNTEEARRIRTELLRIAPLNHYARFEDYLEDPTADRLAAFKAPIQNELPRETYLELALEYASQGLEEEAIRVLEIAPSYPMVYYWLAYLERERDAEKSGTYLSKASSLTAEQVFPFRRESIPVLSWARSAERSWKTDYYLALVYWSSQRPGKALELLNLCGTEPDYAPFYLARSVLRWDPSDGRDTSAGRASFAGDDLRRALELDPGTWRTWHALSAFHRAQGDFGTELEYAKQAFTRFPGHAVAGTDYVKALFDTGSTEQALKVLTGLVILPYEGAREGRDLFETLNLALALEGMEKGQYRKALTYLDASREWPEYLGSGKPYEPDLRLQDLMAAFCQRQLGHLSKAAAYEERIVEYSLRPAHWNGRPADNYIGLYTLRQSDREHEAGRLVRDWRSRQDSLHNWGISPGTASAEAQWFLARYENDLEKAAKLEKMLTSGPLKDRLKISLRAIELIDERKADEQ